MLLRLGGLLLLLVGFAIADLASIQYALDAINAGLLKLDKAIIGLPATADFLQTLGFRAVPILENATQIIEQSAPLTADEATSLGESTAALRQNANLTINDLLARRPFFQSTNSTNNILQRIIEDKTASIAVADALLRKVPDASQASGRQAETELVNIYDRGIALFANLNLSTGVAPAPDASSPPNPSDFEPISLPIPRPANVQSSTGILNSDGSCKCAVQCPVGSLGRSAMMQVTGVMGTTGTSRAQSLQMLRRAPHIFTAYQA